MIKAFQAGYDYIYPQNPLTGQRYLNLLPDFSDTIRSISCASQETQIMADGGVWDHLGYRQIFERIMNDLIPHTKHPHFCWKVTLVDGGKSIEGSTLPGGQILFYRGLVQLMGEIQSYAVSEEDRFAALVAHEMAHSSAYHGYRTATFLVYSTLLQISCAACMLSTFGISTPTFISIGFLYSLHLLFGYSLDRHQEFEADKYGIQIMHNAGYNPFGMLWIMIVFDILSKDKNEYTTWIKSWLATHPSPKERIRAIKHSLMELKKSESSS